MRLGSRAARLTSTETSQAALRAGADRPNVEGWLLPPAVGTAGEVDTAAGGATKASPKPEIFIFNRVNFFQFLIMVFMFFFAFFPFFSFYRFV
jgi:hypothetical protein